MRFLLNFVLFIFGASFSAQAAGWSNNLTVNYVTVYGETNRILVGATGGSVHTTGCTANAWEIISNDDTYKDRLLSALLSAMHSGKKISLWYLDDCGIWSYHKSNVVSAKSS